MKKRGTVRTSALHTSGNEQVSCPIKSGKISVRAVVNGKHVVEHRQRDILLTGEEDLVWEINGTLGKPMHSVQRETPSREYREARRNSKSHCAVFTSRIVIA